MEDTSSYVVDDKQNQDSDLKLRAALSDANRFCCYVWTPAKARDDFAPQIRFNDGAKALMPSLLEAGEIQRDIEDALDPFIAQGLTTIKHLISGYKIKPEMSISDVAHLCAILKVRSEMMLPRVISSRTTLGDQAWYVGVNPDWCLPVFWSTTEEAEPGVLLSLAQEKVEAINRRLEPIRLRLIRSILDRVSLWPSS